MTSASMPEIMVKIIGSKHFRYLAEKPKIKQDETRKVENQTACEKPRADVASQKNRGLLTAQQTNDLPSDKESSDQPSSSQQPPERNPEPLTAVLRGRFMEGKIASEAKIHCSSVPTGEQSLSYIHGLPRRKPKDWSLEHMASDSSGQPEDIIQGPSGTTREDSFLLAVVRRELRSCPLRSSLLDRLQGELKALDRISSGLLFHSQLSRLFLRHDVPLQLPTIKLLCQRFSQQGSPEMVKYGELLCFLKDAAPGDLYQKEIPVDSNLKETPSPDNHRPSVPPRGCSLSSDLNKSLLETLKMVLRTTKGKLDIENLNLSFRREDRAFSGCLPPPKVRAICGKHGLQLTLSLLETLLNHQNMGHQGEIKWQNFIELLSRASSELLCDLPAGKNEEDAQVTPGELEVLDGFANKTEHEKTLEENLQPGSPPPVKPTPQDPGNSLQIRPMSQPSVSPTMKQEPSQQELWVDRFRKLENALYLCDLSNTGVLEKERARRLIHNYNLIYNLSLSPRKIDQALWRFRSGENMLLEPALRYLKEL